MAKSIGVTVKVVPVSGKATAHKIQVMKQQGKRGGRPVGPTVASALVVAEVDATNRDVTVNGKAANRRTSISAGDIITVAERPAGS